MKITELTVANFRNLEALHFSPSPGVNVIYGDNAQGKTNLTEAIWMLTGNRSFRGAKDSELCLFSAGSCHIYAQFEARQRLQTLRLDIAPQKKAFLNELEQQSVSDIGGSLQAVVFSPVHLSMVKDGPSARRRFLDGAITQLLPRYPRYLADLNRILIQRAALLREIPRHAALLDHLEEWDVQLSKVSAALLRARCRYTRRLAAQAKEIYAGIAGGAETFTLAYKHSVPGLAALLDGEDAADEMIQPQIMAALRNARAEDVRQGASTVGPHRDDLQIDIDGISARAYGSQGQQRSAVLALKLAESAILSESTGEQPIILLDDVLSELDAGRREYLLSRLDDRQIFITCCDKEAFAGLLTAPGAKTIAIRAGQITEEI